MNLSTLTEAQRIAAEIELETKGVLEFVEARLSKIYALANTEGLQAEIMAAFGANGQQALSSYVTFRTALVLTAGTTSAPDVNLEVFVPNEDGTVSYVEPQQSPPDDITPPD